MMLTATASPALRRPAKVVLERRVKPGAEQAFEAWVRDVVRSASSHASHEGSSVLNAGGEYFILLRFASAADLDAWSTSATVVALMAEGDAFATAAEQPIVRSGLETWFTAPGHVMSRMPPPKWKMALVTWCALLPQVLVINSIMPPGIPVVLKAAMSTAIPVSLLTWFVMPRLTALLSGWLYAR